MKSGFLGAFAFMLVGAGWAAAQGPAAAPAPVPPSSAVSVTNNYPVYPTIGDSGASTAASHANGPSYLPAEAYAPPSGGPMLYADTDYLLYKVRNGNIPSTASVVPVGLISVNVTDLLTMTPGGPTTSSTPPVVGFAPVSIVSNTVFGAGPHTDFGSQNGARVKLGFWCDSEQSWGLEAVGMFLDRGIDHFAGVSGEAPNQFIINTGFTRNLFLVDPTTNAQTLLKSFPVLVVRQSQTSLVGTASNDLFGGELNARCIGLRIGCVDFGGLLGLRYLMYKDEMGLASNTSLVHPNGFPITDGDASASLSQDLSFNTLDRIRIWNQFYGGQAGIDIDAKCGSFFFNIRGKIAVGDMHQMAQVDGVTNVVNNDPVHITPASSSNLGGLLSSPADAGQHIKDIVAFIPEANLKVGYQFTSCLRGYVGYDAMVLTNVARAGDSSVINNLNTTINIAGSTQNVSVAQPTFRYTEHSVMVQGLTFGMELQF